MQSLSLLILLLSNFDISCTVFFYVIPVAPKSIVVCPKIFIRCCVIEILKAVIDGVAYLENSIICLVRVLTRSGLAANKGTVLNRL